MLQYRKQSTSYRKRPLPSLCLGEAREGSEACSSRTSALRQTPLIHSWRWALRTHSCSHFLSVPSRGLNYVGARPNTLRIPSPGEDTEGWLSPVLPSSRRNSDCQTGSGSPPGSSLLCDEFTKQESQRPVAPPDMNGAATWSQEAPSPLTRHFLHNLQSHDDPQRETANGLQASSGWKKAPVRTVCFQQLGA